MKTYEKISLAEFVLYEIYSTPFLGKISNPYIQKLVAKYMVWKTKRKYKRYLERIKISDYLLSQNSEFELNINIKDEKIF